LVAPDRGRPLVNAISFGFVEPGLQRLVGNVFQIRVAVVQTKITQE
jgi:hypothetical protein